MRLCNRCGKSRGICRCRFPQFPAKQESDPTLGADSVRSGGKQGAPTLTPKTPSLGLPEPSEDRVTAVLQKEKARDLLIRWGLRKKTIRANKLANENYRNGVFDGTGHCMVDLEELLSEQPNAVLPPPVSEEESPVEYWKWQWANQTAERDALVSQLAIQTERVKEIRKANHDLWAEEGTQWRHNLHIRIETICAAALSQSAPQEKV